MKKVLLQDIVIKAGTVFDSAARKTERLGEGHFCHVIGLTNDSSGDLVYYVDPADPDLAEWFGEEGDEFKGEAGNIILIDNKPSHLNVPPERVLEAAKGNLERVLVLGVEKGPDGLFYFCSSTSDKKECLWIVDNFKNQLLNGFKDLDADGDEIDTSEAELTNEEEAIPMAVATNPKLATITNIATPSKTNIATPSKKGYKLIIEPAISPRARRVIERALESLGYNVWAAGQMTDKSSCDIAFDKDLE